MIDCQPVQTKVVHRLLEFLEVNWLLDARHGQPAPESQGSVHLVSPANIVFAPPRRKLDRCREDSSQIGFDAI